MDTTQTHMIHCINAPEQCQEHNRKVKRTEMRGKKQFYFYSTERVLLFILSASFALDSMLISMKFKTEKHFFFAKSKNNKKSEKRYVRIILIEIYSEPVIVFHTLFAWVAHLNLIWFCRWFVGIDSERKFIRSLCYISATRARVCLYLHAI